MLVGRDEPSWLPKTALNRPVTVIMILLALLVVGVIAYVEVKLELLPSGFNYPWMSLRAGYRETNVEQVEKELAIPLEKMVRTVHGVKNVHTNVWSSGCRIGMEMQNDTDMDAAYNELRDRIDRVMPELPDEIEKVRIWKAGNDDAEVLVIMFIADSTVQDPYYLVDNIVRRAVERVDGVANINIWGRGYKYIHIDIDQSKVAALGINLYELIGKLRAENFSLASGHVEMGDNKVYLRSVAKFRSYDEIRNLPIKGMNIRLKDIADVRYDSPKWDWYNRTDGKQSIGMEIQKESQANTLEVCDAAQVAVDEVLKQPALKGMKGELIFSKGHYIRESIDNLTSSALWGGFFAVLILFYFLRRIRMTLVVTLAIPLSLLITITVIYFMGWSLNILTMMGLMICVGMVIDNSIVIVENVFRLRNEGLAAREASLYGASEVGLAVITATMTTIVVFAPIILMANDVGFSYIMQRIGIPVIVALVASLVVALLFIPLATSYFTKTKPVTDVGLVLWSQKFYEKTLGWTLNHRLDAFIIVLLIGISFFYPMNNIKKSDSLEGNINEIDLIFDLPQNYTMERAREYFSVVEDSLDNYREKYNIRFVSVRHRKDFGYVEIFLRNNPHKEWWRPVYHKIRKTIGIPVMAPPTRDEVLADVLNHVPKRAGVKARTEWRQETDQSSISIRIYGLDTRTLLDLAKEAERRLRTIPDLLDVDTQWERGKEEIYVRVNREQAQKYGIRVQEISGTINYALRGIELSEFQTAEKEIDIRVQVQEDDRRTLEQLKSFRLTRPDGTEIPLAAVASFEMKKAPGYIYRFNGKTQLTVTATTTQENAEEIFDKVDQAMAGFELPRGYSWSKGFRYERLQEDEETMSFALYLAVTFVFLLMGVLFESFVIPFSIIVCIPLSFVGVYWTLWLTNTPFDVMAGIGLIILIGVVVNNAIVLIDLVTQLRNKGVDRKTAIIQAGKYRFRPILMTAFTTIFGLIPMFIGSQEMIGISYSPLGRTMAGGLFSATFLTLIAVPLIYTFFDDLRIWASKVRYMFISNLKRKKIGQVEVEA